MRQRTKCGGSRTTHGSLALRYLSRAGKPECDKAMAEKYFCNTYSDTNRGAQYTAPPGCSRPPKPKAMFDTSVLKLFKLQEAVKKRRNRNAPGMNAIPFVVYKKCPQLVDILIRIFNRVWKARTIPASWQRAMVVPLAKNEVLDKPSEFRAIALLNAEDRLFFTLMMGACHMLKNDYINTGVQNGFIERLARCVEHSETIHAALLNARKRRNNLCVSWIDLANSYGVLMIDKLLLGGAQKMWILDAMLLCMLSWDQKMWILDAMLLCMPRRCGSLMQCCCVCSHGICLSMTCPCICKKAWGNSD